MQKVEGSSPFSRFHLARFAEQIGRSTREKLRFLGIPFPDAPACYHSTMRRVYNAMGRRPKLVVQYLVLFSATLNNIITMNNSVLEIVRKTLSPLGEDIRLVADDRVKVAGYPFQVVSAGAGLPRDVDRVTFRLDPETIVVARRFTAKARAKLNAARQNWVDESGAHIRAADGGLIVLVDGDPAPRDEAATGFSPAAVRVGERLLIVGDVEQVAQISAAARVSKGRVAQVLRWFDERGFTLKHGGRGPRSGRSLDTAALLEAWVAEVASEDPLALLAHTAAREPLRELENITRGLRAAGLDHRLTGWVGLERTAPFLTATPSMHIYLDEAGFAGISDKLAHLGLVEVPEAGAVTFWRAPDVTFTAGQCSDAVHPARLMADLIRLGGRGVDAAEHVREERFGVA